MPRTGGQNGSTDFSFPCFALYVRFAQRAVAESTYRGNSTNTQWQTESRRPVPRTSDGKPDLSGLWNKISPEYNRNIAADLKPEDVQPWAQALFQQRLENFQKAYMNVLCVPLGPGYVTAGVDLTYRQIFLDGRKLETAPNPSWMGYSVGHWDGDTLVVESFGFNDRTWLDHLGHPHTEALRMTERYHRRDFGNLDLEVTFSDPGAYSKPWTLAVTAQLAAGTEMLEWVCKDSPAATSSTGWAPLLTQRKRPRSPQTFWRSM